MGAPPDNYYYVYCVMMLLGIGNLLPYNILITCKDYLTDAFPHHDNIEYLIPPVMMFPTIVSMILVVPHIHKISFNVRLIALFFVDAISVMAVPALVEIIPKPQIGFYVFMCVIVVMGVIQAVVQVSVFGFCAILPMKYSQSLVVGNAVAGLSVNFLRMATKAGGLGNHVGGTIYFALGAIILLACSVNFFFVLRTDFCQYYMTKYYLARNDDRLLKKAQSSRRILPQISHQESTSEVVITDKTRLINAQSVPEGESTQKVSPDMIDVENQSRPPLKSLKVAEKSMDMLNYSITSNGSAHNSDVGAAPSVPPKKPADVHFWTVTKKIWKLALSVFLVMFVTFLVFPGLTEDIDSQSESLNKGEWMALWLVTMFNLGDFFGRLTLASYTNFGFTADSLPIGTCIRLAFVPLFIALYKTWFQIDVIAFLALFSLGLTNGHMCCMAFMWAPEICSDDEREMGGSVMSFTLVSGIVAGSIVSIGFVALI